MAEQVISSEHKEYTKYLPFWDKAADAYFAEGGFADGSYLVAHAREIENDEPTEKFKKRQELAFYTNFCAPTIAQKLGHLFKRAITRQSKDPEVVSFVANVDGVGTTMDEFMEEAAEYSMCFGHIAIFADRPSAKELKDREASGVPISKADERDAGLFPYAYIKDPREVSDWDHDRQGNLLWIKVKETRAKYDGDTVDPFAEREEEELIRTWTRTHMYLHTVEDEELIDEEEHNLGIVPCLFLYGNKGKKNELSGRSEIHDLVPLQIRLYNLHSEVDELLRNQALSILAYPVTERTDVDKLDIGTDMGLPYDGAGSPPAYISADAAHAASYEKRIEAVVREILRLGGLRTEQAVLPSGIAYAYDFETLNNQLGKKAKALAKAEQELVYIMKVWQAGSAESVDRTTLDYAVKYPETFHLADVAAEITQATEAQRLKFGPEYWRHYAKNSVRRQLPNLTEEQYKAIDDGIDTMIEEQVAQGTWAAEAPAGSDFNPDTVAGVLALRGGKAGDASAGAAGEEGGEGEEAA